MHKLIEFFKYIFFICYWKISNFWRRKWQKRKNNSSTFVNDQQAKIILLDIEKYNSLFAAPTKYPEIYMPKPIFDNIIHHLPLNYILPDLKTLKTIIDAYKDPSRALKYDPSIDTHILEKIRASVPEGYVLPLPAAAKSKKIFQPNVSQMPINLVKTFVPNVSPDLHPGEIFQTSAVAAKSSAPQFSAPVPTPLKPDKKIVNAAEQPETSLKKDGYRFIFIK